MRSLGTKETLILQDKSQLEVIVEKVVDIGTGELVTYSVPEYSTEEKKYYLQDYFYPSQEDYSGIIKHTGMPVAYMDKTVKDFDWSLYPENTKVQQQQVTAFMFGFDVYMNVAKGLYIHSKTRGSGKTMLACLIGNELIQKGMQVKFIPITEYVQKRFNKEDVSQYKSCTVLIIDDLGAQSDTVDNIREMVYDLINSRYNSRKLTIFTSNVTMDNASKDDRIVSRLYEMAAPVKIPEISIRNQKAFEQNKALLKAALRA